MTAALSRDSHMTYLPKRGQLHHNVRLSLVGYNSKQPDNVGVVKLLHHRWRNRTAVHVHIYTLCMYVHVCVYMYVCTCMCVHVCVYGWRRCYGHTLCMYVCTCMYAHVVEEMLWRSQHMNREVGRDHVW